LHECTLVVTLEPCPMCAGALVNARVDRVVFGASDQKSGACRSLFTITDDPRLNHRCEVTHGVLEADCIALLQSFFKSRR
jgi:tRNA(adenine34) deaminase